MSVYLEANHLHHRHPVFYRRKLYMHVQPFSKNCKVLGQRLAKWLIEARNVFSCLHAQHKLVMHWRTRQLILLWKRSMRSSPEIKKKCVKLRDPGNKFGTFPTCILNKSLRKTYLAGFFFTITFLEIPRIPLDTITYKCKKIISGAFPNERKTNRSPN